MEKIQLAILAVKPLMVPHDPKCAVLANLSEVF